MASVGVSGDFFGDDSSNSIEFSQVLPASGVTVAPQFYSLIEVELFTEWHASFGSVSFDAESGSHRVDVPSVLLTEIRTPEPAPPISLMATVSYATSPAHVTLQWSGATAANVDIYLDGAFLRTAANDGSTVVSRNPGTYAFHVCDAGSTVCSVDVTVTVTQ